MADAPALSLKDDLVSLCDHDQRILVRAIVAPRWEIFIPQPNQQWTKAAVRDKTAQVLMFMASCVPTAMENKDPLHEENYKRVLVRVRNETPERQRLAIYLIAEMFRDKYGRGKDGFDVYDHAIRLGQLMQSMEIEHQANMSGWLYTGVRVDPIKKARDEAHSRVGKRRVR
jgi:hypothetical protein